MFHLLRADRYRCWQVRSLRSMVTARSERNRADLPLLSVARERGVFVRSAEDDNHNAIPEDLSNYKVARQGDLVINKMKAWQGSLGIAPVDGIVSPAYFVFRAAFDVPRFSEYLLRSKPYVAKFAAASDGIRVGQWDLNVGRMRNIEVLLPPPGEQAAIVKYLAHANARINKAIAAKRRLIALLQEHSIVELEGIVHGHKGENVSIGQSSRLVQTGPFGSQLHAEEYVEGGVPVINPSHLVNGRIEPDVQVSVTEQKAVELERHQLREGDVVIARRGDLGRCSVVGPDAQKYLCGTGSLLIRLRSEEWDSDYFQMLFSSKRTKDELELGSIGSTMANLNASQVSRLRLKRPSLIDQRAAVKRVTEIQSKLGLQRKLVLREIALLQEFRTRLVADVVTGQVDVRGVAATLPDVVEVGADAADKDLPVLDEELVDVVEGDDV
ncbi:restriction endonuclease subunit S [Cutibacterium avidum]|nr:restriction endonuclease subunit S [Cutibacterium avidum]MDK7698948.1 restriction endonuclease subunit S [Cutibacterium avidum]